MDTTPQNTFLAYSAAEPMTVLRKRFNRGGSLYKPVPEEITADQALEDIDYVQYVLENAYSGYTYHDTTLFDRAFHAIRDAITGTPVVQVGRFIDVISEKMSFICDGHLSFTTEEYGRGFYERTAVYVADLLLEQKVNGLDAHCAAVI